MSRGRDRHSRGVLAVNDEASSVALAPRSAPRSVAKAGTPTRVRRPTRTAVSTKRTVRLLTLRGLAPAEAANLTAYLCGIPVADRHWDLREINKLLFLRELNRSGRFGPADGADRT
jgi:hypothetical protein